MAEQFLHAAQVAGGFQHVARETVPQQVRVDAFEQALSLRRAARIQAGLVAEAPVLKTRTKAIGLGFEENLIGTGTDDAIDVLDRRVEFRIVPCGKKG